MLVSDNASEDGVSHLILPGEIVLIPPDAIVPGPQPTVPLTDRTPTPLVAPLRAG